MSHFTGISESDESIHEILDPVNPEAVLVDADLNSLGDLNHFYICRDLKAMECNSVPCKKKPKIFELLNIDGKQFFNLFELAPKPQWKKVRLAENFLSMSMCNPEGKIILSLVKSTNKKHQVMEIGRKQGLPGGVGCIKLNRTYAKCKETKYEFELQDDLHNKVMWIPASSSHDLEYELWSSNNDGVGELSGKIFISVRDAHAKEQVLDYALILYKGISTEVKALTIGAVLLMDLAFSKTKKRI
ncbi:unnamed protein product [Allacma fusca]|uniref:Phospholipid scramblase n=1 Tax=Allacma fusca TaxID=39272 RepID=A0A8J2PLS8_9HEXA|nr:unnamed protein product [Allacma fusca]